MSSAYTTYTTESGDYRKEVNMDQVKQLEELAQNINREISEFDAMQESQRDRARRIGNMLIEAKNIVGHGHWTKWLRENITETERTARHWMRFARGEVDSLKRGEETAPGAETPKQGGPPSENDAEFFGDDSEFKVELVKEVGPPSDTSPRDLRNSGAGMSVDRVIRQIDSMVNAGLPNDAADLWMKTVPEEVREAPEVQEAFQEKIQGDRTQRVRWTPASCEMATPAEMFKDIEYYIDVLLDPNRIILSERDKINLKGILTSAMKRLEK
jgi:Protein of unknown function (DUF3102)